MLIRGRLHPTSLVLACAAILFAAETAARAAPPDGPAPTAAAKDTAAKRGQHLFEKYCASCHGVSGVGDGLIAEALTPRPADLTKIAARRNGTFPEPEIMEIIDGRKLERAHGWRAMPVWAERFGDDVPARRSTKEEIIETRIMLLTSFLRSIQKP